MSLIKPGVDWLRQTFAWSNSWSSWQERLVSLAFILIAAALVHLTSTRLAFWQSALAWLVYGLVVAVCSRQGWIKLFGPVLFYDMVRTARRNRYGIIRMLYAGFLFFILCYMYLILTLTAREEMHRRETAMLAQTFFFTFILLQLCMVVLLTPAYVAGAIAEEKDRKTLEFLLATDLRNREIVLSKLLSRVANMTLLLLTGLPIMSILQFMGGVDPELMLAGFAAIGLTMLGLAGVSILLSTLFQKPRDAISLTYLLIVTYFALSITGMILQRSGLINWPIWFGEDPLTLRDAFHVLNAGSPIAAITDVVNAINGRNRMNLALELPGIMERYTLFHLSLALVCIGWSIARVRAIALKQTPAGTTAELRWWQQFRPSVGSFPMLWKEVYIEGRMRLNWLIWIALILLVVLTLGSGLWIVGAFLLDDRLRGLNNSWERLAEAMNIWFRVAGTSVACLMLVMVAVRASTSITSEREKNTLDALLTTPMSADTMLAAKLLGNLLSMRLGWVWFGSMLFLAVCTGGVHPLAAPLILAVWFVFGTFFTMVGLMFSMVCKTSMMATFLTVLTVLFLGGGHWLITSCFCIPLFGALVFMLRDRMPRDFSWDGALYFVKLQAGLTPPYILVMWSASWREVTDNYDQWHFWEWRIFCILGLLFWGVACGVFWFALLIPMFRRITRRVELGDV